MTLEPQDNTVAELFSKLDLTPPAKRGDENLIVVSKAANSLFAPIGKGWSDLGELEQAKFSFLHLKEQPRIAMEEVVLKNT